MEESQKRSFDSCAKMAEFFYSHFDQRRQYEWKVTLGVWTLLVGGIVFVKNPYSVPIWLTGLLVFAHIFLWLKRIWEANDYDKRCAEFFQKQAELVLSDPLHAVAPRPRSMPRGLLDKTFISSWSMQFQSISTIVLACLFYLVKR